MEVNSAERLTLPSGKQLSFSRYGMPSGGIPLLYLHGFPGSRLEGSIAHDAAQSLGFSVFAVDRPGFGHTPNFPGRAMADFPALMAEFSQQVGIARFAVLAVSGGAPYALACAALLPERVMAVGIVSGMGPVTNPGALKGMVVPNKLLLQLARTAPAAAYLFGLAMAQWWRTFPEHMVTWLSALLNGDDKRILACPEVRSLLIQNVSEALSEGVRGAATELLLLAKGWGLPLERIKAPSIFWHGDADRYVPLALAKHLSAEISGAELRIVPEKGHFMAVEMLPSLLGDLRALCADPARVP